MTLFLSKNEKRTIDILELLYSEDSPLTLQTISSIIHCSIKSVTESVTILNRLIKTFEVSCVINLQEKGLIYLQTESYAAIHQLKILTIQDTISYQILDRIFQFSQLTIEKLQQDLFLSRSTIYRKLDKIDQLLSGNGFVFSKTNLTITGNEASIREFFYNFYLSLAHPKIWPFQTIAHDVLRSDLLAYQGESNLNLTTTESLQLTYRLAINTIRYQQKRFIHDLPDTIKIAPIVEELLKNAEGSLLNRIPLINRPMEKRYFLYLYVTYPSLNFFTKKDQVIEAVIWQKSQESDAHYLVSELLKQVSLAFPNFYLTELLSSNELYYKLISVANYALLYPNLNVDLDFNSRWDRRFQSLSFISLDQPLFTKVLWDIITTIDNNSKMVLINPNHVFYFIYSIFSQHIDLKIFENTVTIKIILEVGYLIENDFASKLQAWLLHKVNIVTSEYQHDKVTPYDLIISDLEYLIQDYSIITKKYVLSYPPTKRDINNLKQIIDELSVAKMLAYTSKAIT